MKLKCKWRLGVAVALCSVFSVVSASLPLGAANYIVFGDSLSDMGNNVWVKGPGYPEGAPITNQPTSAVKELWPNVLVAAERMQSVRPNDPLLSSLFATQDFDPYTADVNYAYASAETGDNYLNDMSKSSFPPYVSCSQPGYDKAAGVSCVPGMLTQISLYFNHLSAKGHAWPNPNTVYFLWAGGNDFFNDVAKLIGHSNSSNASFVRGVQQLSASWQGHDVASGWLASLSNPVKNIKAAVDYLHAHHVAYDHIYVFNLPDMSKTPAAEAMAASVAQGKYKNVILAAVQLLSSIYNSYLSFDLTVLDQFPGQNLIKINRLFHLLETNKTIDQQYDLADLTHSCVADHKDPVCTGYAFYNDKHPTLTIEHAISDFFTGKILP